MGKVFAITCAIAAVAPSHSLYMTGGDNYQCVVLDNDAVKCFGYNYYGELGLGDKDYRGDDGDEMGDNLPPVPMGSSLTVKGIAAFNYVTCALFNDETLKCFGGYDDTYGQLGLGDNANRGVEAGEMGDNLPAIDMGTGLTVKSVRVGLYHTCAVLSDDSSKCWGYNKFGNLGLGDTDYRGDEPGEMGDNLPTINWGDDSVKFMAAGISTCAVLGDNNGVKCLDGELGLGDKDKYRGNDAGEMGDNLPFIDISDDAVVVDMVAYRHACFLLDNNQMKCTGDTENGEHGMGDTEYRGDDAGEMGDSLPYIPLGVDMDVKSISVGEEHTCARLENSNLISEMKCFGRGSSGQLGLDSPQNYRGDESGEMGDNLPSVPLGSDRTVLAISAFDSTSCALLDNYELKCFGDNGDGQLGLGDTDQRGYVIGGAGMGDNLPSIDLGTGRTVKFVEESGDDDDDDDYSEAHGLAVNTFMSVAAAASTAMMLLSIN